MSERHPKEGSGGGGAEAEAAEREPGSPTNGERDERRMQHAVEIARSAAEERATAEILTLEDDVERERLNAAKSLEDVQRHLDEAEAKAATATVTDISMREDAAEWLREQRDDVLAYEASRLQQQAQAQVADESKRLQAEFDEQLRSAIAKFEAETEARMKVEASRRLSAQAVELRAEAEERLREQTEKLERDAETRAERAAKQARSEIEPPAAAAELPQAELEPKPEPEATATASTGADDSTTESRSGLMLDANQVSFEELRELGMSITQATRVIAYRERRDGFDTLDDMDTIPGFPEDVLAELKGKLTA